MLEVSCLVGPVGIGQATDGLAVECTHCGRAYSLGGSEESKAAAVVEMWLQEEFGHTAPAIPAQRVA